MAYFTPKRGFKASSDTGRYLPAAGGALLAGANDTDCRFTLIQSTVPGGDSTPLHRHAMMDESFYVIAGSYTITCGDDVFEASPGDLVHLPMGVSHKYVAGPDGGQKLILATPGGLEEFFDDWDDGMEPGELAKKHHIEFLE